MEFVYTKFETYFASEAYRRAAGGPFSKTFSAVSAKPSDGIFAFRHTPCEVATCRNEFKKKCNLETISAGMR